VTRIKNSIVAYWEVYQKGNLECYIRTTINEQGAIK